MSRFNIVSKVTDWAKHNAAQQRQALPSGDAFREQFNHQQAAERFRPSPRLLTAINAALVTRTPLLLTGEAGTGKTQVAWFLKRYFDIALFSYQVHSNSQAKDLRYDFDAVAYLRDAYLAQHQLPHATADDSKPHDDPRNHPRYLSKGALWQAYEHAEPSILLLDEIDKAPRDFPNDLLQELDQNAFEHPFKQGEMIQSQGAIPIIILTSNGERRLPDAFLRRCMVHHIELDEALLSDILQAWSEQFQQLDKAAEQVALKVFKELRTIPQLSKKPGTAELLLWLSVLAAQGVQKAALENRQAIPALECLLKDHNDYGIVQTHYQQQGA